mmetsp:Transcript_23395/g.67440  ORF Transcript_23395/g.67440 Transcript_23395/m.67440 type:complete len:390 (+) Transcript_23395:119-1288(+)
MKGTSSERNQQNHGLPSTPVSPTLEVKVKLQHTSIEDDAEAELVREVPFAIDYLEGNIFVWRPSMEAQDHGLRSVRLLQVVLGCLCFVEEIWIEDVELVALHNLRRGVVVIVVRLIVLVPLEARLHAVEEARLPRPVLVLPLVVLLGQVDLAVALVAHALALGVEADLVPLHALGPLLREEVLVLPSVRCARALGRGRHAAEGLHERLPHLRQDALVLLGVEQVLRIVGRERLEHGAATAGASLLERAQGLERGAEVLLVVGLSYGDVGPVAAHGDERLRLLLLLRGLLRLLGLRLLLPVEHGPGVRLLLRREVPVLDLGPGHEERDLGGHGLEELRVHAFRALLQALLDLCQHALQLGFGLGREQVVDLGHYALGHAGAQAAQRRAGP